MHRYLLLSALAVLLLICHGHAQRRAASSMAPEDGGTIALWLFDEPQSLYPSANIDDSSSLRKSVRQSIFTTPGGHRGICAIGNVAAAAEDKRFRAAPNRI